MYNCLTSESIWPVTNYQTTQTELSLSPEIRKRLELQRVQREWFKAFDLRAEEFDVLRLVAPNFLSVA